MKKLALLAAVLLGTAAASQAGLSVHIGIPLPPLPPLPLPGVIFSHPAPVVVAPRPCPAPVVVAPPCGPVHGYNHGPVVYHSYRYDHYRHDGCGHGHDYRDHGRWHGGHR